MIIEMMKYGHICVEMYLTSLDNTRWRRRGTRESRGGGVEG